MAGDSDVFGQALGLLASDAALKSLMRKFSSRSNTG